MSPRPFLLRLLLLVGAATSRLDAQDVTVSDPAWLSVEPAPDQLPRLKSRLRPEYPDEMRKVDEPGYVLIVRTLDEKGTSQSLDAIGSHLPFQRSVEDTFADWKMSPAQRAGKPVAATICIAVIYNPKAASPQAADASPRLLSVCPAMPPSRPTPGNQPPVVPMKLSLDAAGAVIDAVPQMTVKPNVQASLVSAVKSWRFAPARRQGQPVAAELVVPVVCLPPPTADDGDFVGPKLVERTPPRFPYAMRRYAMEGMVTVEFDVDSNGKVVNPFVQSSNSPAFEEPALEAVRKWRFEPALRNGKPTQARMRVPVVFQFNGPATSGAFAITARGDQAKLPPELQFDTPPKIRNVLIPVYPYVQRRDGKSGKATVTMLIGRDGKVKEVQVNSADQPEFGAALTAAVEGFVFDPALKNGKPVLNLLSFQQTFDSTELWDDAADALLRLEKKHPERIVGLSKLDQPLKPISRRPPTPPVAGGLAGQPGEAVIEFLVDEDGRARLPRIISATAPGFGFAAIQAINTWRFEPPVSGGKPVVARIQIPVKFAEPRRKQVNRNAPTAGADVSPGDRPAITRGEAE
jgi:TonB family protein